MPEIVTIGLDIAKNVFQLHARRQEWKDRPAQGAAAQPGARFLQQPFPPCLIGLEACATAHHWARTLMAFGHDVRLIPPAYVKPYLRRQKNDAADAAAICEAVTRPSMRFVPVKSPQQQSTLMLHGARDLLIGQRTALINALRGHFAELGIVVAQGRSQHAPTDRLSSGRDQSGPPGSRPGSRSSLWPRCCSGSRRRLPSSTRPFWRPIAAIQSASRLAAIPGIGPIVASCLSASVPDASLFQGSREFAAYLGLVPRQHSTGGKARLGSISKMGNRHLRKLLVVGAHAALYRMKSGKTRTALADWARASWPRSRSRWWPSRWPTRSPGSPGR